MAYFRSSPVTVPLPKRSTVQDSGGSPFRFGDWRSNGIRSRARRNKTHRVEDALIVHAQGATRERFLAEWEDLISSELH